ncbi:MAG: hypothetical protein ABIX37_06330 [Gammaproteobacteria bacterium]
MRTADPLIRRRWLIGGGLFAATWFLSLWPLANAIFGAPGAAPTQELQAGRLIYEELVKCALLLAPVALAGWLGVRMLAARTFPPPETRVPVALSITLGPAAIATGCALLLGALLTVAFRLVSLKVSLQLAALLRGVG